MRFLHSFFYFRDAFPFKHLLRCDNGGIFLKDKIPLFRLIFSYFSLSKPSARWLMRATNIGPSLLQLRACVDTLWNDTSIFVTRIAKRTQILIHFKVGVSHQHIDQILDMNFVFVLLGKQYETLTNYMINLSWTAPHSQSNTDRWTDKWINGSDPIIKRRTK